MDDQLRCPEPACAGWVCLVEDARGPFHGCGACGSVWRDAQALAVEIARQVATHPHRAAAYVLSDGAWKDAPAGSMADDYEDAVAAEGGDPR